MQLLLQNETAPEIDAKIWSTLFLCVSGINSVKELDVTIQRNIHRDIATNACLVSLESRDQQSLFLGAQKPFEFSRNSQTFTVIF